MGNSLQTQSPQESNASSQNIKENADPIKEKQDFIKGKQESRHMKKPLSDDEKIHQAIQYSRALNDIPRTNNELLRPRSELSTHETRYPAGIPRPKSDMRPPTCKKTALFVVDESTRSRNKPRDNRRVRETVHRNDSVLNQTVFDNELEEKVTEPREVVAYFGKSGKNRPKSDLHVHFEDEVRARFNSSSRRGSVTCHQDDKDDVLFGVDDVAAFPLIEVAGCNMSAHRDSKRDDITSRLQRPKSDIPVRSKGRQVQSVQPMQPAAEDEYIWNGHMCRVDPYQDTTIGLTVQNINRLSRSLACVGLKDERAPVAGTASDVLQCYGASSARIPLGGTPGNRRFAPRLSDEQYERQQPTLTESPADD